MIRSTVDRLMVALLAVGIGVSGYLTYVHFTGARAACPTSGCERVQESFYSSPHGVPLPLTGLLLFLALAALFPLRGQRARSAEAGVALGGATVAVYLIGVQLFSLSAICIWCVVADTSLVLLAPLAVARLLRERPPVPSGRPVVRSPRRRRTGASAPRPVAPSRRR